MASNSCILPFIAANSGSSPGSAPGQAPGHPSGHPSGLKIASGYASYSLLGPGATIERVRSQIRRVAPHFRSALLTGGPGSRGEDAARSLHSYSPLHTAPLRILNAEQAELRFGGPSRRTLEMSQGMLYLPEVEHLSPAAQDGLLQWMRSRGTRGASIVAFTGRSLRSLVSTGAFSAELAALLGSLRIALPQLAERREDVPALLCALIPGVAVELGLAAPMIGDDFLEAAAAFDWPRNFDQMEALVTGLLTTDPPLELRAQHFRAACEAGEKALVGSPTPVRMIRLEQVIQEHIRAILVACNGNKLRTAEVLGISRSTLYRTLESAGSTPTLPLAG